MNNGPRIVRMTEGALVGVSLLMLLGGGIAGYMLACFTASDLPPAWSGACEESKTLRDCKNALKEIVERAHAVRRTLDLD